MGLISQADAEGRTNTARRQMRDLLSSLSLYEVQYRHIQTLSRRNTHEEERRMIDYEDANLFDQRCEDPLPELKSVSVRLASVCRSVRLLTALLARRRRLRL